MTGWRTVLLALAVVLLGGAGGITAVERSSEDRSAVDDVAAGDEPTTTTSTFVEPTTTTSTTSAAPTTTGRDRATTTTTRRTTTTRAPAGATTTAPFATTTPPAGPSCSPEHLVAAIVTDKASYGPGEQVKVTTTLRNQSPVACLYNGYGFKIEYRNDAGARFGAVHLIADSFRDVPLRAGDRLTQTPTWDHRACPEPGCGTLPPGPYLAVATWTVANHTYEVWASLILS